MKSPVNFKQALNEKQIMQKQFIRSHGFSSSVLTLLIEYYGGKK